LSLAHTSEPRFLHCGTTKCAVPPVGLTNTENLGIAREVREKAVTMYRATGNSFAAMRLVVAIEERFLVAALLGMTAGV